MTSPISALEFRQPDNTGVLFDIGRLESTHPIQIEWPHRHTFYEIIWVIDGAGVHAADFEEHAIGPQTVFLVSPRQVHAMRVDSPLSGYKLAFTADFFVLDGRVADAVADLPFFRVGASNPVLTPAGEEAARLRLITEDLLAEFTSRASWRREMLRARFQSLVLTLGRVAQRQGVKAPPVTGTSAKFRALVDKHFRRLHRVADYAALLALTPGHLNRLSKEATGEPASAVIEARLVLEAKRLLVHSDAPAAEIAAELGFPDPSYFGRFFRRHVGQSPRAFRAAMREKYQNKR